MNVDAVVLREKLQAVQMRGDDDSWRRLCHGPDSLEQIAAKVVLGYSGVKPRWFRDDEAITDVVSYMALRCNRVNVDGNVFSYLCCVARSALSHLLRDQGRIFGQFTQLDDYQLETLSREDDVSMGDAPVTFCKKSGCCRIVPSSVGWCDEHKPGRNQKLPGVTAKYGRSWRGIRDRVMGENPSCVRCGSPGEVVHHIIPLDAGGTHDRSNLEVLCRSCHERHHGRDSRY